MVNDQVSRSPLRIIYNTLPEKHLSWRFSDCFDLEVAVKPAIDDTFIILDVRPLHQILDAKSGEEVYRFQTSSTFRFSGQRSRRYLQGIIYYLICLAIEEFNGALQATKSMLVINRIFPKPEFKDLLGKIIEALDPKQYEGNGITRHWHKVRNQTQVNNHMVLATLPVIPVCKEFANGPTLEQQVLTRTLNKVGNLDKIEYQVFRECIHFYKTCREHLSKVDLCTITNDQVESLLSYLGKVFTVTPTIFNDLWIGELYRVSIVADAFLEEGKVRNPKFLSYPPLDIIRSRGVYNRANSPETTVFYAAESESVAIREVKPGTGQRIVLATWVNRTQSPLLAYPLCLTAGIENEYADRSTYAFEQFCKNWPPLISEWAESILSFIAQEFIKEQEQVHPKRYDYLYSAFFADRILQPFPEGSKVDSYECLVYPSVAGKHVPSNVAIRPEVVDNKLTLIKAREFEVMETRYDRALRHNELPARLKLLRESKIISNNRIIWDDDCT